MEQGVPRVCLDCNHAEVCMHLVRLEKLVSDDIPVDFSGCECAFFEEVPSLDPTDPGSMCELGPITGVKSVLSDYLMPKDLELTISARLDVPEENPLNLIGMVYHISEGQAVYATIEQGVDLMTESGYTIVDIILDGQLSRDLIDECIPNGQYSGYTIQSVCGYKVTMTEERMNNYIMIRGY